MPFSENNLPHQFVSGSGFKGYHTTDFGKASTGYDYLVKNGIMTNSLAAFFMQYYRDSITETEIKKANDVAA